MQKYQTVSDPSSLTALAHDSRTLVQGHLSEVTVLGCLLEVQSSCADPEFQTGGRIQLHLLEELEGKAQAVVARVKSVKRESQNRWSYRLTWGQVPELAKPQRISVEDWLEQRRQRQPSS
jgi:hypothetical protein